MKTIFRYFKIMDANVASSHASFLAGILIQNGFLVKGFELESIYQESNRNEDYLGFKIILKDNSIIKFSLTVHLTIVSSSKKHGLISVTQEGEFEQLPYLA